MSEYSSLKSSIKFSSDAMALAELAKAEQMRIANLIALYPNGGSLDNNIMIRREIFRSLDLVAIP